MVSASPRPEASAPGTALPPFLRLRYLLVLLGVGLAANWLWPRAHAAWRLHNEAVAYADYALCMVGPSGPDLLREQPEKFLELTRRRVISAMPQDQPLLGCQALSEKLGVSHRAFRVHGSTSAEFAEYHNMPGSKGVATLAELDLSLARLDALSDRAWPFVRSGAQNLMRPTSHAKESPHAPPPPRSGSGSGLPASHHVYRSTAAFGDTVVVALGSGANAQILLSTNGGLDWTPGGTHLASEIRDRCPVDAEGRAFSLSRMNDGTRIAISLGPDAEPLVAALAPSEEEIAGVSCDESALVAALVQAADSSGQRPLRLRLCPYRRPCRDLRPPEMGGDKLYYPADIARLGGDTVVARTSGGITRVTSSRDDGRSWMPWMVAYDSAQESGNIAPPFRLLAAGDDLLLYAGAAGSGRYALLVSSDHGASFQSPLTRHSSSERRVIAGVASPKR